MASITLTRTWITLADDLTQSVVVDATDRSRTQQVQGQVRQYAAGRLRFITQVGQSASLPLTFRTQDRDLIDTLTSWIGQLVLIRDPRGRAEWGVFSAVQEQDLAPDWTEVQIQLARVSHSVAV